MQLKNKIKNLINTLPYIKSLYSENKRLKAESLIFTKNSCFPAGHYYSPIISVDDIKKHELDIWSKTIVDGIPGIDLRVEEQINLLKSLSQYLHEIPFRAEKQANLRFYFDNGFYGYTDSVILFSVIRHFKPERIIEIGSGFSSAVILDTNELFFQKKINLAFVEPHPERLHSIMNHDDIKEATIIQNEVQVITLDLFEKLQAGDILFIDSTHVAKTGSDVNFILFDILPVLKSGVIIHFHDVSYPFEYPKEWVYKGRNWNETYFLKAFLMYNMDFEIIFFSDYMHKHHFREFENFSKNVNDPGMNLWLMKK
jgi:hypothetical protein